MNGRTKARPDGHSRRRLLAVTAGLMVPGTVLALAAPAASAVPAPSRYGVSTIVAGPSPYAVAVDPAAGLVYVTNDRDSSVSVLDRVSGTLTRTIPVGRDPVGVAVDPGTHTAYVANYSDDTVSVIDGTTGTVTGTVSVGSGPYGLGVDPARGTVYVAAVNDNTVSVIDETTMAVTDTIDAGYGPSAVGVDPVTGTVYVAKASGVSVIDESTGTVTHTIYGLGSSPSGVAVDPTTATVYVTNELGHTVSVIDERTAAVTGTIYVGTAPNGVGVDPTTGTVYVANSYDSTVSVIDGTSRTVTDTIATGAYPFGLAVDPTTATVYVSDVNDHTVSVIKPAPANIAWEPQVRGYPQPAAGAEGGIYLGVVNNIWKLRVTHPARTPVAFNGTITLDTGSFARVRGTTLEPGDTYKVNGNTITFHLADYGDLDGLNFSTPGAASAITFTLSVAGTPASAQQIRTGSTAASGTTASPVTYRRTLGP